MVRENDLAELTEKMLLLLDDEVMRSAFSRNAREDILREASIEGMFQSFRRAVEFVMAAKGGARSTDRASRSTATGSS